MAMNAAAHSPRYRVLCVTWTVVLGCYHAWRPASLALICANSVGRLYARMCQVFQVDRDAGIFRLSADCRSGGAVRPVSTRSPEVVPSLGRMWRASYRVLRTFEGCSSFQAFRCGQHKRLPATPSSNRTRVVAPVLVARYRHSGLVMWMTGNAGSG